MININKKKVIYQYYIIKKSYAYNKKSFQLIYFECKKSYEKVIYVSKVQNHL